ARARGLSGRSARARKGAAWRCFVSTAPRRRWQRESGSSPEGWNWGSAKQTRRELHRPAARTPRAEPFPPPSRWAPRCPWLKQDTLCVAYHDEEWGVPEYDDRALYEKLILDGFQAGWSWITILRKRENFRRAFDGFEPEKIARYTPKKIEKLMQDAGI